jgi:outer membrane biosynthesis protein TonB
MARELFGEVSHPEVKVGSRAKLIVPVSIALHVLIVGAAVFVPMMAPGILPAPPAFYVFAAPALPAPPPAGVPEPATRPSSETPAAARTDAAPLHAPDTIAPEGPPALTTPGTIGVVGGVDGGVELPGAVVAEVPLPPPPPTERAPVRPGGDIKVPVKVHHVPPVYPIIAQQSKVEGIVILEATIDVDGRVRDGRVLQ